MELVILFTIDCTPVELVQRFVLLLLLVMMKNTNFGLVAFSAQIVHLLCYEQCFFYVGKRFCIRGGEEQRNLGPSQFLRSLDPDCLTFVEHGSKNRSSRANELHLKNKEVPCPAIPENRPCCMVYLMDLYILWQFTRYKSIK